MSMIPPPKDSILQIFSRMLPESEASSAAFQTMSSEELRSIARKNEERIVGMILMDYSIQPHMLGYVYLRSAILLAIHTPTCLQSMKNDCYEVLAEQYQKSPDSIERAIRLAISHAWKLSKTMKKTVQTSYCPSNREFIAFFAERIKIQYF